MAREPDKSGRETGRETGKAKSEAMSSQSGANDETADPKSKAPEAVEQLKTRHRDLQAMLAKRSESGADPSAIVKEFAVAWIPHFAVDEEILLPALDEAGVDAGAIAANAIQKDIINMLLADLLRDEGGDLAGEARGAGEAVRRARNGRRGRGDRSLRRRVLRRTLDPRTQCADESTIRTRKTALRQHGRSHRRGHGHAGAATPLRSLKQPAESMGV